jgi:predicted metalloprotease with PDZ domain
VQESFVEQDFAVLNGASLFVTLPDRISAPHEVTFVLPPHWSRSMTGLDAIAGAAHRYRAADFDTLLDSPALLGNPAVYEFEVGARNTTW